MIWPIEIMMGATIRKFATMPSMTLDAMRMPIRPPAPTIARSNAAETPSCLKLMPLMFGSHAFGFVVARW
jgi:hypothetical protein